MSLKPLVAAYKNIDSQVESQPIEVIFNRIVPKIINKEKKFPKYKKVGKAVREELISMVDSGWSIISVTLIS